MNLVVFGNCQAGSIAEVLRQHHLVRDRFSVQYVPSFDTPGEERVVLSTSTLNDTKILVEQVTPLVQFGRYDELPADCKRVTFPSLDFNLLWPLNATEKRNRPELPDFPFGRFPYGDRFINEVVERGLSGTEAFDEYMKLSGEFLPRVLGRLEQIEVSRWGTLERDHTVKMSDYLFGSFRRKRIFHTYNHPTRETLCELIVRVMSSSFPEQTTDRATLERDVATLFSWDFGADIQIPIHPAVAQSYKIEWWATENRYNFRGAQLTYREFIEKQIGWL